MGSTMTEYIYFKVPVKITYNPGERRADRRAALTQARQLMRELPSVLGSTCSECGVGKLMEAPVYKQWHTDAPCSSDDFRG